jgi:hypothetical protein
VRPEHDVPARSASRKSTPARARPQLRGVPRGRSLYARHTYNNPLKYTDPTGHCPNCGDNVPDWEAQWSFKDAWYRARGYIWNQRSLHWDIRGFAVVDNASLGRGVLIDAAIELWGGWSDNDIIAAATGVADLARAAGGFGRLVELVGGTIFYRYHNAACGQNTCAPAPPIGSGRAVYFPGGINKFLVVHELAHIIDWNNGRPSASFPAGRDLTEYASEPYRGYNQQAVRALTQVGLLNPQWEYWADAVGIYVYGRAYPGTLPEENGRLNSAQSSYIHRVLRGR